MNAPIERVAPPRRQSGRVWLVVAIVALVTVAVWVLLRNGRSTEQPNVSGHTGSSNASTAMPGMDMSSPGGGVRLTASQIREFGVTFDTVKIRTLENEIRAPATIATDETRIAQITPKFSGFVERLFINSIGQQVRKGQAVAAIFSPDLYAAEQELVLATHLGHAATGSSIPGVGGSTVNLQAAARQRLRLWDVSDAEIDAILRSGQASRTITLFSPATGVVTEKSVVQGQSVVAGTSLMTVADLSTVWVIVELREADARSARVGTSASVEINAFPGERIAGHVSYVYPTLMEQTRTIRARVILQNPDGRLKPGMFATVALSAPLASGLSIPATALIETGDKTYVFVKMKDGSLMPHDVKTGRRSAGLVEILSGVDTGAVVVTSAQFLLDSESNIGEVMRSMIGQGPAGAMGDMPGMSPASSGSVGDKGADTKGLKMPSALKK